MSARRRIILWVSGTTLVVIIFAVMLSYSKPIGTPLRAGMNPAQVRLALDSDPSHSYTFYSSQNWCSRGVFSLGDIFSYHTWIGYSFDPQSRLTAARGYYAITVELPILGFHDYEFPMRKIELPE